MKANEKIEQYMTVSPHCVNAGMPLKKARELMRTHGIRHLPVQLAGRLVGVITDRDLKLAESFDLAGELLVDDAPTVARAVGAEPAVVRAPLVERADLEDFVRRHTAKLPSSGGLRAAGGPQRPAPMRRDSSPAAARTAGTMTSMEAAASESAR